jgi:hypothetical protein
LLTDQNVGDGGKTERCYRTEKTVGGAAPRPETRPEIRPLLNVR